GTLVATADAYGCDGMEWSLMISQWYVPLTVMELQFEPWSGVLATNTFGLLTLRR
ncbi:hypothetical protein U1Q18_015277, partial [Sarracenia purpurea var. burkii]